MSDRHVMSDCARRRMAGSFPRVMGICKQRDQVACDWNFAIATGRKECRPCAPGDAAPTEIDETKTTELAGRESLRYVASESGTATPTNMIVLPVLFEG